MHWIYIPLVAYLSCGCLMSILVGRSAYPKGRWWALVLWPMWLIPRVS